MAVPARTPPAERPRLARKRKIKRMFVGMVDGLKFDHWRVTLRRTKCFSGPLGKVMAARLDLPNALTAPPATPPHHAVILDVFKGDGREGVWTRGGVARDPEGATRQPASKNANQPTESPSKSAAIERF